MTGEKYWEMIVGRLRADGWSIGWIKCQARDWDGWKVDAHKEGQRHHVEAEDISVAFLELEASIRQANRD